ncbi:ribosomal protein S2, flavodoxin-like domain-containing protein [Lineolata rhizophorae]|uniref:Ribosomal protein S2, flavodoxin-like domain-containing protein n=1 Tax=Lineolata rhizophorae TaxID=578093 RepID=A0A6A6P699_9PEZI|nr:ribosomal protein S2, flavodoxin-like domain-containing protein [Lineolata rhizophorae]
MILRQLALRQGRRTLSAQSCRPWRRYLSSEVDRIEDSLQKSSQETHSIESMVNAHTKQSVPSIGNAIDATTEPGSMVEEWHLYQHMRNTIGRSGSDIMPHYKPHVLVNHPPGPAHISLELLLASQCHLGHSTSLWNPANSRYIFGVREGIHIISLEQTAAHLRRAAKIVREVCLRGGVVLFAGTRDGHERCVVKAAELAGGCHLFDRWTPGSITNGQQLLEHCRMKVVNEFDEEVPGFENQLQSMPVIKPDLVVCLNPLENFVLLRECGQNNIPTIGIIDTDADPSWVTYQIPANDDSLRSVQLVAGVLGRAGEEGQEARKKAAREGKITFRPPPHLEQPQAAAERPELEKGERVDPIEFMHGKRPQRADGAAKEEWGYGEA